VTRRCELAPLKELAIRHHPELKQRRFVIAHVDTTVQSHGQLTIGVTSREFERKISASLRNWSDSIARMIEIVLCLSWKSLVKVSAAVFLRGRRGDQWPLAPGSRLYVGEFSSWEGGWKGRDDGATDDERRGGDRQRGRVRQVLQLSEDSGGPHGHSQHRGSAGNVELILALYLLRGRDYATYPTWMFKSFLREITSGACCD